LAKRAATPQAIAFVTGAEIRTIDAEGVRDVLVERVPEGRPDAPCWSPDGAAIVFAWRPRGSIWLVSSVGGSSPQVLCGTQGGGTCRNPKWSPRGDEIAVIADREGMELPDALLLVPITGGPVSTLYTAPAGYLLLDVAWSGDGSRLAISEYLPRNGGDRIRVIERETGASTIVLSDLGAISFLDWARTRDELAFAVISRSGVSGVFTCELPAPGTLHRAAPLQFCVSGSRPSYAPDDAQLVFQRVPPPHRHRSIHAVELVSGRERLITSKGMSPNWKREVIIQEEVPAGVGSGRGMLRVASR